MSKELDDFNKKFNENTKYSDSGLETKLHMPCPFCAEPDFLIYKILDMNEALAKGAVCSSCHRGIRGVFTREGGSTEILFVQTTGDDPPPFLPPILRDKTS